MSLLTPPAPGSAVLHASSTPARPPRPFSSPLNNHSRPDSIVPSSFPYSLRPTSMLPPVLIGGGLSVGGTGGCSVGGFGAGGFGAGFGTGRTGKSGVCVNNLCNVVVGVVIGVD
eukprot:1843224-Rhodomonas_salina.1